MLVGALTVAVMWWLLPAAGAILAVALLLAATVVPWLTGRSGPASGVAVRRRPRRLAAAVVDLTEGAAELVVFGAADAQVAAHPRTRRRADRHRHGLGPDRRASGSA